MPLPLLPLLAVVAQSARPPALTAEQTRSRLRNCLDATGLHYSPSASGLSFTVKFTNDKRSQTIFVSVADSTAGAVRAHMIYTTVWASQSVPPDETTLRKAVLASKKLGAFYIYKDAKGVWALRFGVAFDATDLGETSAKGDRAAVVLADTIQFVNAVGEETDKALNGDSDIP